MPNPIDDSAMQSLLSTTRTPVIVALFSNFYQENATFTCNLFIQYYNANPKAAASLLSWMVHSKDPRTVQASMGLINALNEIDRNAATNLLLSLAYLR